MTKDYCVHLDPGYCAGGNVDTGAIPNPEVFLYTVASSTFTQVTNTKRSLKNPIFSSNPCFPARLRLAFVSNADLTSKNADGNAEDLY